MTEPVKSLLDGSRLQTDAVDPAVAPSLQTFDSLQRVAVATAQPLPDGAEVEVFILKDPSAEMTHAYLALVVRA